WKDPKTGTVYETVLRVRKVEVMELPPTKGARGPAKTGTVSGTVRYKGLPLPGGVVTFHLENGAARAAKLDKDGKFTATDVPVGPAKVTIETESPRPAVKKGPGGKLGDPKEKFLPGKGDAAQRYVAIPRMYGNPNTSPLTVEVRLGRNVFDIELN